MAFLRLPRLVSVVSVAFSLFAGQAGCDSSVEEQIALARLAQDCLVNSDCSSPLVCAFEACHAECESSRDCDDGARCVAAARPYKVCQLEQERACERTSDCAEGLVCGVDGECRDECLTDNECVEGQLCVSGTCADTDELDGSGQLEPAPGMTPGSEGSPCVYVSDCSAALLCRSQSCLAQCKADRDCKAQEVCMDTRCVPDGSLPAACSYTSDCDSERGERCLGGSCLCACVEDRDCPSGQLCDGCSCEAEPNAAAVCTYNSDCEMPGEVCKNRACACACQADADCGAGSKCDGCGCIDARSPLDGVVTGNVVIDSTLQLATYRGVVEIHGDVSITGASMVDLGDTFDQLQLIEGSLYFTGNQKLERVSFPALESVKVVSVNYASGIAAFELPSLTSAAVYIGNLPSLTALALPELVSGDLQLYNLPQLTQLRLPLVKSLTALNIGEAPLLDELLLPELTKLSGSLHLTSVALSVLSAPQLALVGEAPYAGSVIIHETQLPTLDDFGAAGWVMHATSLQITANPSLSRCAAEAFVARCASGGFDQATELSGNADCTSCNGSTCED